MGTSVMAAIITGIVGPVFLLFINQILKKRNEKPDIVLEALKVSELVVSRIEKIKDMFKCDRVWVAQFHNGGNFYPTGKSMAKFSIIYESVSPGTPSIQSNFHNIPVNLFSRFISQLFERNFLRLPNQTTEPFGILHIGDDYECKSCYFFSIKTIDGKFIGMLGINYIKEPTELSSDEIKDLSIYSASIGGVLMNHLNKK